MAGTVKHNDLTPLFGLTEWTAEHNFAGGSHGHVLTRNTNASDGAAWQSKPAADVRDYGALGDGTTDDTAAIQAALTTGLNVLFPAGTYRAANLTQSTAGQHLIGIGTARLIKNANGPILTIAAADTHLQNLLFRGESATPAFTGDNLVVTGDRCLLDHCGSRWAYARALKATGARVMVHGTQDIWQTADQTASGYDIEVGVSGTATLYHSLIDIYTSQATGGILFTDTGSHIVQGGQFGKYTVLSGTSPAGINGGIIANCRVLGTVTVNLSNAVGHGNQFGAIAFTLGLGTSGCVFLGNMFGVGATVTNSGNANNLIIRDTSTGSYNSIQYGGDTSIAVLRVQPDGVFGFPHHVEIANAKAIKLLDLAGTSAGQLSMTSGNNLQLSNGNGWTQIFASGTNSVQLVVGGNEKLAVVGTTGYTRLGGASGPVMATGTGSPEGVVTAVVGSLYLRTDGGAGTSHYVKESGAGNVGWVAK